MSAFEIEGLSVTLDGRPILRDACARFAPGLHAVVGRSGAGKSVLMKAACGLLPAIAGRVHFPTAESEHRCTLDVTDASRFADLRQSVTFVHQDPALLDDLSAAENLRFALDRRSAKSPAERAQAVDQALAGLDLQGLAHKLPRDLPPGAQRQVALARALLLRPQVLIADEPTTGLDPAAARDVDRALLKLSESTGAILIVITHDLRSLAFLQPTLHLVDQGAVRYEGKLPTGAMEAADDVPPVLRAILAAKPFAGPVGLETVDSVAEMAG